MPVAHPPMRPLRIAMIGQRGVPATFGGIEHHVEEIGARLAARGHEVTVYARTNYTADRPIGTGGCGRGICRPWTPNTSTRSSTARWRPWTRSCGEPTSSTTTRSVPASSPSCRIPLSREGGADGPRPRRRAREVGRAGADRPAVAEWLCARVPDATIVVSKDLATYYRTGTGGGRLHPERRQRTDDPSSPRDHERLGLRGGAYVLFVGRMVPEKAPDLLIRAFRRLAADRRLVLAGGSSFTDDYLRSVEALAPPTPAS